MQEPLAGILNFVRISDRLGTAGQPTAGQFEAIREAGYEVVINLALSTSTNALADEAQTVTALGMEYLHIPVIWESPTQADLDRFFEAIDRRQGRLVFVHCAMNMLVSAFVLLYRVIRQGLPLETAREAMLQIWEPDPTWAEFIAKALDRYRDRAGS